nr:MAG: hypothetical protein DIU61_18210 [Bacteroidota bacterium]
MDQILTAGPAEIPVEFWYTLSILLATCLIGIIWRFANQISATLRSLEKIVITHETEIRIIKEDLRQLKEQQRQK